MALSFQAKGRKVIDDHYGEITEHAAFDTAATAIKAAELMNRAYAANNAGRYTDSARLYQRVRELPGHVDLLDGEAD